jgi:hypothetical protein
MAQTTTPTKSPITKVVLGGASRRPPLAPSFLPIISGIFISPYIILLDTL